MSMGYRRRAALVVLALSVSVSGCVWTQYRGDPGHGGVQPFESTLSAANVRGLTRAWSGFTGASNGVVPSVPVVGGGAVYTTVTSTLEAFDASGASGCSGTGAARTCSPLWTARLSSFFDNSPAIANGMVFAGGGDSFTGAGKLFAFDAAGSQGCGGSPRTCAPLWIGDLACCEISAPVVVGNTVYVTASDGELAAFDVNGGPNCTMATPKVCQPLWSTGLDVELRKSAIAVANGRVYVGGIASRGTGEVEVFDAAGTSTAPLWIGVLPGPVDTSLVVVNGVLYLGSTDRKLYAYDALGATNCAGDVGTHTCLPIWTAPTGDLITFDAPAVADGKLYVGTNDGLFTFDANGSTNCAGSPKTCAPISTTSGPLGLAPPTVANGVVYVGSVDGTLDTLQACSTVGPNCTPFIGSVATGAAVGSPVVAGGAVYVRSGTNVQAYRLG